MQALFATPVRFENHSLRHTYNSLIRNGFCVCQLRRVLHYFLRTESRMESNRNGMRPILRIATAAWHTQNGPEPRVA